MTLRYKLTGVNDHTYAGTQWRENITHQTDGQGNLCGPGWIQVYTDPLLAVLLDPIHGAFGPLAHLWECQVSGQFKTDHGLKEGWTCVTTLRRIDLPQITAEQRVRFGILAALEGYHEPNLRHWASRWLDGTDRTHAAARAAAELEAARAAWAAEAAAANRPLDLVALAHRAVLDTVEHQK